MTPSSVARRWRKMSNELSSASGVAGQCPASVIACAPQKISKTGLAWVLSLAGGATSPPTPLLWERGDNDEPRAGDASKRDCSLNLGSPSPARRGGQGVRFSHARKDNNSCQPPSCAPAMYGRERSPQHPRDFGAQCGGVG